MSPARLFRLLPLLLLASACAEPVDPGRRAAEQEVKRGVPPELQEQIDQAIRKARACLIEGCTNNGFAHKRIEELEQQAEQGRASAEKYRAQSADAKDKDATQATRFTQTADSLESNAKAQAQKAQELRKSLGRDQPIYAGLQFGLGEEALVGLALVQAGVSPYDPVVRRIWRDQFTQPIPMESTVYAVGLQLMLADALMHAPCGEAWPEDAPKASKARRRAKDAGDPPVRKEEVRAWIQKRVDLLAGSARGGAWGYTLPGAPPPSKGYAVSGGAPEIGSDALVKAVLQGGDAYDYSNTQYAVLGLKAAALCGVRPSDADTLWRQVIQQFLVGQEADGPGVVLLLEPEGKKASPPGFLQKGWEEAETGGRRRKARARGWAYRRIENAPPPAGLPKRVQRSSLATMGAAGLTALLVGRSELKLVPKEAEKVDEAIRDGLAWMQEHWSDALKENQGFTNGYMLYGLERMGVLGSLRSVGGHDWYAEGAQFLVKAQQEDGSWKGSYALPVETSLCLLFLTRGTREAYARSSYEVGEMKAEPKP